jgi:glycosyltransferase involved in cell wall biosynthesis
VATAIVELDAAALPDVLRVEPRYDSAFILVRWHGHPVGQLTLAARDGVIDGVSLRRAIVIHAGAAIERRRLHALLGADEAGEPPLPSISPAVCTRDRPDDLANCLAALERTLWDPAQEIVVVDSCSASGTTREVVARFPRARYVRENRPGLDIARNRALRECRSEVVAFTDDDAVADPGWLRALARRFASARTLCVTGLTIPAELETEAQRWFEATNGFGRGFVRRRFDGIDDDPFHVARAGAGVNMALRRSVLELVGPFDEALDAGTPTRSGGDHDMFTRILLAGYCIEYEPAAMVRHRHRREWRELVDTVRGYGTGVYAHLTRHLLDGETRPIRIALGWLWWQTRVLLRTPLGAEGRRTRQLGLAELRGCAEGPFALLRSRRMARTALAPAEP